LPPGAGISLGEAWDTLVHTKKKNTFAQKKKKRKKKRQLQETQGDITRKPVGRDYQKSRGHYKKPKQKPNKAEKPSCFLLYHRPILINRATLCS
jgi:hypothetical protein